jgi:hypothetical protein
MLHFCVSNGKCVVSMIHFKFHLTPGGQKTVPLLNTDIGEYLIDRIPVGRCNLGVGLYCGSN